MVSHLLMYRCLREGCGYLITKEEYDAIAKAETFELLGSELIDHYYRAHKDEYMWTLSDWAPITFPETSLKFKNGSEIFTPNPEATEAIIEALTFQTETVTISTGKSPNRFLKWLFPRQYMEDES